MKIIKQLARNIKKIAKKFKQKPLIVLVLAVLLAEFAFPQNVAAGQAIVNYNPDILSEQSLFSNSLPVSAERGPRQTMWVTVTAYTSTPDQTDNSPCITANGYNVCEHNIENVVAANFLPFGTRLKMPEYFGEQTFIVQDRMNARYTNRVDVWMTDIQKAREFGVRYVEIEIY